MSRFMVGSQQQFRASLYAFPGMQHLVHVLDYKQSLCCNQSLFTAYCHVLNNSLRSLAKQCVLLTLAIKACYMLLQYFYVHVVANVQHVNNIIILFDILTFILVCYSQSFLSGWHLLISNMEETMILQLASQLAKYSDISNVFRWLFDHTQFL